MHAVFSMHSDLRIQPTIVPLALQIISSFIGGGLG